MSRKLKIKFHGAAVFILTFEAKLGEITAKCITKFSDTGTDLKKGTILSAEQNHGWKCERSHR